LPPAYTGDEARIFLRAGHATVGIGGDRYRTARLLLERFPNVNILVLDDGFQHARMPRDVDVVVIDGMDPWGGGSLVPLGRLREPLTSLQRASIIVVTRAEDDHRYTAIRARLQDCAGDVPIFRSRTKTLGWRDPFTFEPAGGPGQTRAAAFCGLGNPGNFWSTLGKLGIDPVFRWAFPDHHRYRLVEVHGLIKSALAHDVRWLLTTEKDCNNLPEGTPSLSHGIRLAWLAIELEIENEEAFYSQLLSRISAKLQPL
jgi:tetraacyldisaccharide 4'-kinase